MDDRTTIYINGEWVASTGGGVIDVENPATGQIIAHVPEASVADVDAAVAAARAAFPAWSTTPVAERVLLLRALRDALTKRHDQIAATITAEMGAPHRIADKIQAALPQTVVGSYADLLEDYSFEETVGNTRVFREPAGVVGAITPWNYPLHQITCKLAPALAAGCTFVLKPSEMAPLVAYLLFDALDEAGFPPGVVNLVPGYGRGVGEALAGHPDVDVVSFTGSVPAGKKVAELAARNVSRVTLELGGKSANIILDDADLPVAVKVGVSNAFLNSGQTCTAWTRMLVPADRYDEAVELASTAAAKFVVGDPTDPGTKLGPVVSAAQRDKIRGLIDTAVAEGARIATGGTAAPDGLDTGYFVRPTVLADVTADSTIAQEEVFGPVLSVIAYRDEDDAVAIANNSKYGLHGAVWSADTDRAMAVARRIRTGSVDINGAAHNPLAPFGGYKQSGVGRELGGAGLEEYLEIKSVGL
ncbi:MAG TPA: aldehyde dehydrogenase family protein [Aldersonia sp.]